MPIQYFQEEQPCTLVLLTGRSAGCFLLPGLRYEPKKAERKKHNMLHSINTINMVCKMQVKSNWISRDPMQLSSLSLILTAVQDNSSVIMLEWMCVQSGCISNCSCTVPYHP
jgi:hypothetical protein